MTYRAPVRDLAFSLRHAADFGRLADAFPEADTDTVAAVLEAAGAFAADVLAPLNRGGDTVGAKLENGVVRCAPGFADAYKQFAEGGWASLAAPIEHGGQGLPKTLEVAVLEMIQASNMAFGLCPMLSLGAIEALELCGTDSQKHTYLPKLVSGEWTGTMNLTEPQAGSDLAALTTVAMPDGEGGWKITGQKIFITWGDHDAADNICPPDPGPNARRPSRREGHLAVPGHQGAGRRRRQAGRGQWRSRRRTGAQAGHPRLAHLRDAVRGRQGRAGRGAWAKACRTCS
jgi:alkylation response protein AidB-like acyl-CoA dehydrogenase